MRLPSLQMLQQDKSQSVWSRLVSFHKLLITFLLSDVPLRLLKCWSKNSPENVEPVVKQVVKPTRF